MITDEQKLRAALIETKTVDQEELEAAVEFSECEKLSLSEALLQKDLISDENLGKLVADLLGFPFIDLKRVVILEETLRIIPEIVAKKQKIIAFERAKEGLKVAMLDPKNIEIKQFIEKKVGDEVLPYFATERDINDALSLYAKDVAKAFDEIITESVEQAKVAKGEAAEPPIIKIVDTILSYAHQNKVSDIHIEPLEEKSLIRFRVDGVLHDIVKLPVELHPQIVTRVKVLANLRTDEHQAAQDGKLQFEVGR